MKKIALISSIFLISIGTVLGCWFSTTAPFCYIAGVNYYQFHVDETQGEVTLDSTVRNSKYNDSNDITTIINNGNGLIVSLPITVWFKVKPRIENSNGVEVSYDIAKTILYYKIIPRGKSDDAEGCYWRVANVIDMTNSSWNLDFNYRVRLFGNSTLTKKMIQQNGDMINSGDSIIFAWYIVDNSPLFIANAHEIESGSEEPRFIVPESGKISDVLEYTTENNTFASKYNNAYVLKVLYNGKTTPGR